MQKSVAYALVCLVFVALAFNCFSLVKAQTFTYTLHGPYYPDDSIPTADITVTVQFIGQSPLTFTMSSNGTVANTTIISSGFQATTMTWNASSSLNLTSVYDFLNDATEEVYLYIPDPDNPTYLYYFSVTDFGADMVNPYLQASIKPDGVTTRVTERRSLNGTSTVTFVMEQFKSYTLTFICDAGTYSQSFFADTTYLIGLPVLYGMFPTSTSETPTLQAVRMNSSLIEVTYDDPTDTTNWLTLNITHRTGATTIYDYYSNTTGNTQIIDWNYAVSGQNYIILANASISGTIYSWQITVPMQAGSNPWDGRLDWLGPHTSSLPVSFSGWPSGMSSTQVGQLVAAAIMMLFLGIGSYKNAGASMVISWIAGAIMLAMGWWIGGATQAGASSIPLFALGLFIGIFTHLQEKKSEGGGLS